MRNHTFIIRKSPKGRLRQLVRGVGLGAFTARERAIISWLNGDSSTSDFVSSLPAARDLVSKAVK